MDRGTKNSLLFGALVGGIYALGRNAAKKQNLTDGQKRDLEALKNAFASVQSAGSRDALVSVYDLVKQKEPEKNMTRFSPISRVVSKPRKTVSAIRKISESALSKY